MTLRAIGIDVSLTATGLALPDGTCRTLRPLAGANDRARRLHQIVGLLRHELHARPVDVAVVEGYFVNRRFVTAAIRLAELGGPVRMLLFELGIPFVEITPAALKLYAAGDGGSDKTGMINAACALGATVANDNEADAWWLRLAALQKYEPTLDRPQLTKSMTRLPWPTLAKAA